MFSLCHINLVDVCLNRNSFGIFGTSNGHEMTSVSAVPKERRALKPVSWLFLMATMPKWRRWINGSQNCLGFNTPTPSHPRHILVRSTSTSSHRWRVLARRHIRSRLTSGCWLTSRYALEVQSGISRLRWITEHRNSRSHSNLRKSGLLQWHISVTQCVQRGYVVCPGTL